MLRLLPLLFLLFSSCQSQSFTEVTGVWTPVSNNETLGSLSQLFYGHENLWELLAGSNKRSSFELSSPGNALTKDSIVTSKILIPPASNCPLYMNSSCLQILNYLEDKHNGLKGDDTISELLRTKLNLDTPLVWDTRIKDDATTTLPSQEEEDGSRALQALEPLELFLISWDISTLFRENLGLTAKNNVTRGTFALNIINQTPKTLTDFEFLSDQCGSSPSQSFWTPLLIEPGKTGQVISQQLNDIDTGVIKLRVDDKTSFLITWRNENLLSLPTEVHVLRMMPDTVTKEEHFNNQYICSSPQEWKTTRLNYRYSIQAFVGGTKENRVANLIISEDWKDEGHHLNDIYPKALYKILNHPKSFVLTASTNYSNPLYPIYQVYQSDQIYGNYQEWQIDLVELSGTQEVGYMIRNSQSGLVLSAIEPNILVLQRYEENDQDRLRAQLWLLKLLGDNSYHIQNLKFKSFLSTQDKADNYASWALQSAVDETRVSERFFLEFLTIDRRSLSPVIQENYYYSFAPERFPDMKVMPEKSSEKVKILNPSSNTTAGTLDNNIGYWLLKKVTLPARNITGYLIMNHYLNAVLTMTEDKTLVTSRLEKNTNPSLAEAQLWQITLNQSDLTKTGYTISSLKDQRYFVSLNGSTSHGSQLVLTKNPDTRFLFTNSHVEGYIPYRYSTPYHINSFATLEPYVVGSSEIADLTLNGAIIGSKTAEQTKKWSINAALWGATDALTLRSNAEILGRTDYYLTNINGTPQLVLQDLVGKKYEQSWKLVADPEYYDLVYQINPYNSSHLYLTTPVPQTNNVNFTLTSDSKSQGQRFRFMVANEAFPVFNLSAVPPTKIPDDNFYFQLSPATLSQMKITVNTDNTTLSLSSGIPLRNRQYWLLKRVTLPGTTTVGTIIMNHELNIVLTQQDTTKVNGATMVKASSTDNAALAQLWDVQMLDDNSCTIRNFRYSNSYLNLVSGAPGASLIPLPITLYNSQRKGENPLQTDQINATYLISAAFNREPYVVDTFSTGRIYGWPSTGYDKQRWMIENAIPSVIVSLKTLYQYPRDNRSYYLTYSSETTPTTSILSEGSNIAYQRWALSPDVDYYGLFYRIQLGGRYLTAPASKTADAAFTIESSTTRPQDQRFRFMSSHDFQLIPDDYYYTVALETDDQLRLEATDQIATTVEVQPKDLTDRRQFWLFRRTTLNGITGYVILNDDKNAAITLSTGTKVIGATVTNRALNTNYVSQVWDVERLEGDLCRFKSLKTQTYYLALNGNSNLIASTTPSNFKCSQSSRKGYFSFKDGAFNYIMTATDISPYVARASVSTAANSVGTVLYEPKALVANDKQSWEMKLVTSGVYNVINRDQYPVYLTYENRVLSSRKKKEELLTKWEVEVDGDYHNLYYRIQEYGTSGQLYLQTPSSRTTGAAFFLDGLATTTATRQDQRFRIRPVNEDL